jgi:GTP cyclohydrolase IA
MTVDRQQVQRAIEMLLSALGRGQEDHPELEGTPARVAALWADDLLDGYDVDVAELVRRESLPQAPGAGLVLLRGLAVSTVCPHHLLPSRGTADVVYAPGVAIVGLGTIGRVVDAFAHRFALQETIAQGVAASLVTHLGARGAGCRLAMSHTCLTIRGERQTDAVVETLSFAGSFSDPGPEQTLAALALTGHSP